MKVSALSAALAQPESSENISGVTKPATDATSNAAWESLHRNVAFPCLRHARPDDVRVQEVTTGHENVDVRKAVFPGTSVTTGSLQGSTDIADYEINPYKRRGGKEVFTSSYRGASLGADHHRGSIDANLITGAVYGSLRAGLTLEEKNSIKQSSAMSPSMNMLTELGLDKVNQRTAEAKKMRRHVLKGAVIVFITAGYSGKRFIFERCKLLGLRTVIVDGPDSWSKHLVDEDIVEKFVPMDFSDADTLFDRLLDSLKVVRRELGDIDGITTFCELAVPLVARLAENMGLPGNTPAAVDTARNKHAARQCMEQAALPTPKHFLLSSAADLEKAAAHVGFPAVIKPISGAASIGVIRVNDFESLQKSYARVVSDLKSARVVAGALVEGTGDEGDDEGNASSWLDISIMMEEYLDGPEVDVDLVFSNCEPVYGCITDNWPTVEPYFNETGSNCPSILPWEQQVQLLDLAIKSVQCMGFEMGVFHVELKFTSRGPRLIEVNARMGGGPVRDTNLLVWGVDLVEEHILACCGIPLKPSVAQQPLQELAEYTINAPATGVLERDDFMEKYAGMEGVLYARPLVKAGAKCVSVTDGMPTWLAEIMVSMKPVQTAIEWIQKMEKEVTASLPIRPT